PEEFSDRLIDVASYPDTNDLMLISDVLITDYSSVIYEYSLLERPMIFFAYDLDTYSATRGMHKDYREAAPGNIATTFDELVELIRMPDLSNEMTKEFVKENFDYVDTHNSDRVIDSLILSEPADVPDPAAGDGEYEISDRVGEEDAGAPGPEEQLNEPTENDTFSSNKTEAEDEKYQRQKSHEASQAAWGREWHTVLVLSSFWRSTADRSLCTLSTSSSSTRTSTESRWLFSPNSEITWNA